MQASKGFWGRLRASLILVCCFPIVGVAFTLDDNFESLADAARWSNSIFGFSLVDGGVRGLGGGLEYALASDFCSKLISRFIDNPKPTCNQLKSAIQSAFNKWAAGHPILKFTDVTGRIVAQLPPAGHPSPWDGFGAEIDFFALTPQAFPQVTNLGSYTSSWYLFADPTGTNGAVLPGNSFTNVDIVFNIAPPTCYHLSAALTGRGCNHFESLVLHEIGHALGLDHPNEFPHLNYDTDNEPTNKIHIDCENPTKGLKRSSRIDPKAVMNSSLKKPEPVHAGLTNDDIGGRDFLYPICEK